MGGGGAAAAGGLAKHAPNLRTPPGLPLSLCKKREMLGAATCKSLPLKRRLQLTSGASSSGRSFEAFCAAGSLKV